MLRPGPVSCMYFKTCLELAGIVKTGERAESSAEGRGTHSCNHSCSSYSPSYQAQQELQVCSAVFCLCSVLFCYCNTNLPLVHGSTEWPAFNPYLPKHGPGQMDGSRLSNMWAPAAAPAQSADRRRRSWLSRARRLDARQGQAGVVHVRVAAAAAQARLEAPQLIRLQEAGLVDVEDAVQEVDLVRLHLRPHAKSLCSNPQARCRTSGSGGVDPNLTCSCSRWPVCKVLHAIRASDGLVHTRAECMPLETSSWDPCTYHSPVVPCRHRKAWQLLHNCWRPCHARRGAATRRAPAARSLRA